MTMKNQAVTVSGGPSFAWRRWRVGSAAFAGLLWASVASGQSVINHMGVLPGVAPNAANADVYAYAVSADGSTATGRALNPNTNEWRAFRWVKGSGMEDIGRVYPGADGEAGGQAISGDGSVVAGNGELTNHAFRWTSAGGRVSLGSLAGPGTGSSARGISIDGSVIVGWTSTPPLGENLPNGRHAFRWENGVMQDLGVPSGSTSQAAAVSANGLVFVGYTTDTFVPPRAIRWADGGVQILEPFPGRTVSVAAAVSADGSTVGGASYGPSRMDPRATRWTANGVAQDLGVLPGGTTSEVFGVNHDGTAIVGKGSTSAGDRAFLWTPTLGMVALNTYLPTQGADISGWILTEARAISPDGTTIVGNGLYFGRQRAWLVCCVDQDGDALCDDWETNGVPYTDAAGISHRYMLDAAGNGEGATVASPLRKDIFVEVDAMDGRGVNPAALERVRLAFDRAPVPAPAGVAGGLAGITLHVVMDIGHQNLPRREYPDKFVQLQEDKRDYFGNPTEYARSDWPMRRAAKALAYRYCIFADSHSGDSSSGAAELPGNDFMVTLGLWDTPGGTEEEQAGTFMHELGHTLGLQHGGDQKGDSTNRLRYNYKPNYFSVMNYTWQYPTPWMPVGTAQGRWGHYFPNFSDRALPTLDERSLNELVGIQGNFAEFAVPYSIPAGTVNCDTATTCATLPSDACTRFDRFNGPVDWDNDCTRTSSATSVLDINNIENSTGPSPGDELTGFNDWINLRFNFRGSVAFLNGEVMTDTPVEMDFATHVYLNSLVPPTPCHADVNVSGTLTVQDIFDFLAFYFSGDSRGDFNGVGGHSVQDIFDFLAAYFAGCE